MTAAINKFFDSSGVIPSLQGHSMNVTDSFRLGKKTKCLLHTTATIRKRTNSFHHHNVYHHNSTFFPVGETPSVGMFSITFEETD